MTAQRRVNGSRGVKTYEVDRVAITDMLLAGRGAPVVLGDAALIELQAWVAHRRRRVGVRTATKNQLLGRLDRCFPGLSAALHDVLGSKVGRLVAADPFADPIRLAHLGEADLRAYAARRDGGSDWPSPPGPSAVAAARGALPTPGAAVVRDVLAADLALLTDLEDQIGAHRGPHRRAAARHPLPGADHRARLGHRPRGQLRRHSGPAGPLGRGRQDLPGSRAHPGRLRLRRQSAAMVPSAGKARRPCAEP